MSSVNGAGNNLDEILDLICADFELKMSPTEYSFICENDLEEVWQKNDHNFESLFSQLNWDSVKIRRNYVKLSSFLISINRVMGDKVKSLFFTPAFEDTNWPLKEYQLSQNLEGWLKKEFIEKHSCFSPVVINQFRTPQIQVVEPHWRLPFLEISEIGRGGFGTVREVTIPPRYLSYEHDRTKNRDVIEPYASIIILGDSDIIYRLQLSHVRLSSTKTPEMQIFRPSLESSNSYRQIQIKEDKELCYILLLSCTGVSS